ncbi:interleukin-1 receptor type 2-like [Varanus komodoensis]|uniref:interleukin-1 receptor type 2-like n=1 Tax=Varanus komodoensis TaxID=61221 RepID=UPI001CF7C725|nr:interleukin-1 receptor type 2-like [Varanus komodoensis]
MPPDAGLGHSHALGFFLALLCSCSCFHGTESGPTWKSSIFSTLQYNISFGQKLGVLCQGYTAYKCEGLIYWLANGTFVDNLYPEAVVLEGKTREKAQAPGCLLERELFFYSFSLRDLETAFTCTILDPSGPVQRNVTWHLQDPKGLRNGGLLSSMRGV